MNWVIQQNSLRFIFKGLKYEDTPETTVWKLASKWNNSGKKNREGKEKGNKLIERRAEKRKHFGSEIL